MTLIALIVILILIAVNALYVAAEFSAVSVQRNRIRVMAENGNRLAARLLPILEDTRKLDRYIAACQIGITVSSLVLGAYGQAALSRGLKPLLAEFGGMQDLAAQSAAAIIVLVGLTVLQVILGELIPKSLALQYPSQVALYTLLPMRWSLVLFSWFILILNGSGGLILRLLGVQAAEGHRHIHSPEEIDLLLAESRDGGLLEPDEHQRLRRALQLGMRKAGQLMVPRLQVVTLNADATSDELMALVKKHPHAHFPVYSGNPDNIIGFLHTKELALRYVQEGEIPKLLDVIRPVTFYPETLTADRLLANMREARVSQAVVMGEYGNMQGLVTLDDLLTELLGEVGSEFQDRSVRAEKLADGRVRLPGLMRLYEVEQWIGVKWSGEANTVGGRVIEELKRLPVGGEKLVIDEAETEVEQVMNHAVISVLVTPPPLPADSEDEDEE